jgi:DNA-binding NarL/FixJ family response regulator
MIASLSPTACQVLQCMAHGLSTEEVADQLAIPVAEVRQHLDNALTALGASSRLDAVVRAARQGLVELPRSCQGESNEALRAAPPPVCP